MLALAAGAQVVGAPGLFMDRHARPLRWLFGAYLVLGAAALVGRRLTHDAPGLVQVRLDQHGCSQHDADAATSLWAMLLRAWERSLPLLIVLLYLLEILLWFPPDRQLAAAGVGALLALAIAAVWWARRPREEQRRRLEALRKGLAPAESRAGWAAVARVRLDPLGGGRFRLRLVGSASRWHPARTFVDAAVHCTPEQADALRTRISGWRRAKGAGG